MATTEPFLDTNVLVYLVSGEQMKADVSDRLVQDGGIISVQVMNEFARTGIGKLSMSFAEVRKVLKGVRATCDVVPLTIDIHEKALEIAERHRLHIYDASIVAAALAAGCTTLLSEDMHNGLLIDGLTIRNPYLLYP